MMFGIYNHNPRTIISALESYPHLLVEDGRDSTVWPPPYDSLSSEAQELFKDRPYRAASPFLRLRTLED
jgi:hypothetical protein